ncbi:copper-transporting ATPase PAA1, chloroplastic isoform X3 [Ananas comosus]|uniref:Copper-transporting ATPase PAA1, chloroplastic isoform X3 n=1 Tax=Ananas comosus TaxID=4615 RepID=A0A6P5F2I8_ANACO|nr:copper-transporting ATPase PAA1, chloroplastic isoform X3 [Ananas comosus]
MESPILPTIPLVALSKTLKLSSKPSLRLRRLPRSLPPAPARIPAGVARCFGSNPADSRWSRELFLLSFGGSVLWSSPKPSAPLSRGLASISGSLPASSGPPGGGGGGGGGGDGSGGGGRGARAVGVVAEEAASPGSDVIILDVGGMSCGGCAASVKRILESLPQVTSASVNLATETAVIWAASDAKDTDNWKQHLGEKLADHLTACGFKSNFRDSAKENLYSVFERKMDEKLKLLKESGRELAVSWALCAVCVLGHASHFFGGWKTFFEEPIMLIAFVLLGKNLEQRAKLKATSDMTGLLNVLPKKARLVVDNDPDQSSSFVEVPCNSLAIGDRIIVLPGDRVPADGVVKAGKSTVDESSLTGEAMPVTKLPGAEVTAGSINLNGKLTVEVRRPGGETVMADIVRLVEEAQTREAPVQRLADKVAGHFTYGVMALSAATFMFWNLFGSQLVPAAIQRGSSMSLALQLSCSVLVVACPCALGLATPTAVLVGTSLGATKGLLLRGGNVLEKLAEVDTIVFDKTGTLTTGRPVVTQVMVSHSEGDQSSKNTLNHRLTEVDILALAAGVESYTNHPLGKAIVEAARVANSANMKVKDGTFREEPGSGAVAIIEQKEVAVGTLSWLRKHGVVDNPFPNAEADNQSVVYVGIDGVLSGLIYFEDKLREDAQQVIETLSKKGISTYMLSGDKESTAEHVAAMVGIQKDRVIAAVKPHEKKKFISKLQEDQKVVAMVGDGINDAAALASSHIGIAMGEGVGAASDVSSVVLMGNRLSQLVDALELSKETMKTVKQNLWWAFAYNIVGLPIAAGILLPVTGTILTPSIAGALMGFSSVGVMANSLLLRLKLGSNSSYKFQQESKPNPISSVVIDIK